MQPTYPIPEKCHEPPYNTLPLRSGFAEKDDQSRESPSCLVKDFDAPRYADVANELCENVRAGIEKAVPAA
jgi:hypothetical protein